MIPLATILSDFVGKHLPHERGVSRHTVAAYSDCYRLLLQFAAQRFNCEPVALCFTQLDQPTVLDFLSHLEKSRGNSAKTRNARLAAIKSLFTYAAQREPALLDLLRSIKAIPSKKSDSKLITAMNQEDLEALLDAPDRQSRLGMRDRAMLLLALNAGLRVSELVGLELADLDLKSEQTVRVMGKGRKERVLPLWPQTTEALKAWLCVRGEVSTNALFVNARGRNLSRWGFSHLLDKYLATACGQRQALATKHVTPHVLRHTCAMLMLHATHDLRKVALWLGHSSVTTTEVYTRVDPTVKLEAVQSFMPPSLKRGAFQPTDRLLALLKPAAQLCAADRARSSEGAADRCARST